MTTARHPETHLSHRSGWLRAAVLGANDGIVSVAAIIVGVVFLLGSRVKSTFSQTESCIGSASTTC